MAGELIRITGLEEVQQMLERAPRNIVLLGYGKALKAGINVVAEAVVARTPISGTTRWNDEAFSEFTDHTGGGSLVAAATNDVQVDANGKGGIASMGFGKMGHVANFVEYGHRMVGHKPKKKDLGTVQPHPFMRPAADASADAAIDAFGTALAEVVKAEYK